MLDSAFELAEQIKLTEVPYCLHPPTWERYDLSDIDLNLDNWATIKYMNDDGDALHDDINNLPNNTGGIYLFSIRCPIIPGMTEFPAYVGRAKLTDTQNLRKRCREYFNKWHRSDERPKITRMINYWGPELFLNYLEIDNEQEIVGYEKKLINSLLLPFNERIPEKEIQSAVSAF